MTDKKPGLDAAYALQSADDNRALYADWAESYDSSFAGEMDYVLPLRVAEAYLDVAGPDAGPVLDVGAGTGLCGAALRDLGIGPIEATDLSPQMLAVAERKGIYTRLFEADLLQGLPCDNGAYTGVVSSGTFTTGHLGAEALDEVLRIIRPGGWLAISVNRRHYDEGGFAEALAARDGRITTLEVRDVRNYGPGAQGDHAQDLGRIVTCRLR
ncbi:class I SAM-dependent DNA methyltransferase [Thalassococcus sp. BH17M4-6]|uniref:class I SAM-dependent DNA methyltransferase n=1 Tax=Thalassococcus sp. BH17M4-6 TaxID=3413148 RepID=UPI003BE9E3D6